MRLFLFYLFWYVVVPIGIGGILWICISPNINFCITEKKTRIETTRKKSTNE